MKLSLWGTKFWHGFCSPRHPGVFLIFFNVLVSIAYLCIYVLIPLYYGALSYTHHYGYLILFSSNCLITLTGVLMMGFLTMPSEETSYTRCIFVFVAHALCLCLGITAFVLIRIPPGKAEMRRYVVNYFHEYYHSPRLLLELQEERNCCGINGLSDFFTGKITRIVPHSCCTKERWNKNGSDCGDFRNHTHFYGTDEVNSTELIVDGASRKEILASNGFVTHGCFSGNLTYADLPTLSPSVHLKHMLITSFAGINILLTLILFGIFSYYTFYRLPIEPGRPDWTNHCACCIKACCPKKLMVPARPDWKNSSGKIISGDEFDEELEYEKSELYVGPLIKVIPPHCPHPPEEKEHVPNVSDIGSLISTASSGSMLEMMV